MSRPGKTFPEKMKELKTNPHWSQPQTQTRSSWVQKSLQARTLPLKLAWLTAVVLAATLASSFSHIKPKTQRCRHHPPTPNISAIQQCTIDNLQQNLYFLGEALPITTQEFLERRNRLASALVESNVSAFILEPGYSFQYYANISQTDWEPWEPEERPFLMIIRPHETDTGEIEAKTSFLAPHFEEDRVRMLGIPSVDALEIVTWEEHWNPYTTLLEHTFSTTNENTNTNDVKVIVDEEMRDFLVRGLTAAGFHPHGLTTPVETVRQIKSPSEIAILRAVNTGTVEAVRQMRPCLQSGLTETQVMNILDTALRSIEFEPFFDIVLFEENAALPHGGFDTGGKVLTEETMVLIDVGAHFLGYSSDICRSFMIDEHRQNGHGHEYREGQPRRAHTVLPFFARILPFLNPPTSSPSTISTHNTTLLALKHRIHALVLAAQSATIPKFTPNATAASVDLAARSVIAAAGHASEFTHRVGHGIGIKAHESPYLHLANKEVLREGMTFTSEPGAYIRGLFGVRTEDVFLVRGREVGGAECLSGRRARGVRDP